MDCDEKYIKNPTKIGLQFQGVVKQIACGKFHTMVLMDNNCILTWGSNEYGQCGKVTDIKIVESPFKVKIDEDEIIKSIVCGEKHSLVLYDNGTVYGWGSNEYGQLGLGKIKVKLKPIKLTIGYDNIKQIVCGGNYTLALTNDGIVYAMGSNRYGQLMNGNHFFIRAIDVASVLIPLFPLLLPQFYPPSFFPLFVLYCFPNNFRFIQRLKNYLNVYKPITIKMKFKEIAAHGGTSMGIDMNGECYIWGNIKRFWEKIFIPKKVGNCRSLNEISALYLGTTNKTIQVDENQLTNMHNNRKMSEESLRKECEDLKEIVKEKEIQISLLNEEITRLNQKINDLLKNNNNEMIENHVKRTSSSIISGGINVNLNISKSNAT